MTFPRAVTKMEVRRAPVSCLLNRSTLWEAAGTRVGLSQQLVLTTGAERFTCGQAWSGCLEGGPSTLTSPYSCGWAPAPATTCFGEHLIAKSTLQAGKTSAGRTHPRPLPQPPRSSVRSCPPLPPHLDVVIGAGAVGRCAPQPGLHSPRSSLEGWGRSGTPGAKGSTPPTDARSGGVLSQLAVPLA